MGGRHGVVLSEFLEQKKAFYQEVVTRGISSVRDFQGAFPLGVGVPESRMSRWLDRMYKLPAFSSQRRYVNRFKLGADPEFVFFDRYEGSRIDAAHLGMKQGLAFGADNNGRLTEIRPYPSRSALKVCASILNTLRWLAVRHPEVSKYEMQAGAFLHGDGIGGHVHFGRKRPHREREIAALDVISEMLWPAAGYSSDDIRHRRDGDRLGQHYGMPGDFRLQNHGYEYRTFPSWLGSPALAFLTITLAKLAVYNPELLLGISNYRGTPSLQTKRLINFLSYYKDVDDDALLACYLLRNSFPKHQSGDFKPLWGIGKGSTKPPGFIPSAIPPSNEDIQELFQSFLTGATLQEKPPSLTWTPSDPPKGYRMMIQGVSTTLHKGLGELIWDICVDDKYRTTVTGMGRSSGVALHISPELYKILDIKRLKSLPIPCHRSLDIAGRAIGIFCNWREGEKAKEVRKALLSGVFPMWQIRNVAQDSLMVWEKGIAPKKIRKNRDSQVLDWQGSSFELGD